MYCDCAESASSGMTSYKKQSRNQTLYETGSELDGSTETPRHPEAIPCGKSINIIFCEGTDNEPEVYHL